jgi:hypothetical protein
MTTTITFPFIPRKLTRKQHDLPRDVGQQVIPTSTSQTVAVVACKETEKKRYPETSPPQSSDEDYAILISLALSNHALWSNPELRRKIEEQKGCTYSP